MIENTGDMKGLTDIEFQEETEKGNAALIFTKGEKVQVKGGDFVVEGFGKKFLRLRGLPGTRMIR